MWLPASPDARSQEVVADDGVHHRVDPLPAAPAVPPKPSVSRRSAPVADPADMDAAAVASTR